MEQEKFKISLVAARINAGMTQDEVAERLEIGKQSLYNWEKGRADITIKNLKRLCELYKVPLEHIRI